VKTPEIEVVFDVTPTWWHSASEPVRFGLAFARLVGRGRACSTGILRLTAERQTLRVSITRSDYPGISMDEAREQLRALVEATPNQGEVTPLSCGHPGCWNDRRPGEEG